MSAGNEALAYREIMDIKAAANYLGVSRSHLSHILAGKIRRRSGSSARSCWPPRANPPGRN